MTKRRRIIGLMIARNEVDRYLEASLRNNMRFFDSMFVYDDLSTDKTFEIAADLGCEVSKRSDMQPSFLEDESKFREQAWHRMYSTLQPEDRDWVVAVDADEFLVAENPDVLRSTISQLARSRYDGITFTIPEVFGHNDKGVPLVRTDGFWGQIRAVRAVPAAGGVKFRDKAMGGGSVPNRVRKPSAPPSNIHLLHYGYADPEDREDKYQRYSKRSGNGHNARHIRSIVEEPSLVEWEGPLPYAE